jgi:FdrA protein
MALPLPAAAPSSSVSFANPESFPALFMTTTLHTAAYTHANLYKDSVALMRVAQRLLALPGVVNASLQMGNPANKDILQEAGLLTDAVKGAGPSDIMVVVQARTTKERDAAIENCRQQLAGTETAASSGEASTSVPASSLAMGAAAGEGANLAQISVPGAYAAAEALKALKLGLNVFMFSDNVPLDQEVAIKQEATRRGLLVMGPDCGTAIIGGMPLGFANAVRRGNIGVVAASGTGLQEVTTQIHRMGGGVSQAIGTGGRDLYAQVGGATMLQGIALLAQDPATDVIAIVSKPPAPEVAARVMTALEAAGKPAVVLFLGSAPLAPRGAMLRQAHTLVDCAAMAVKASGAKRVAPTTYALPRKPAFASSQRYLRALYAGGTFTAEAQVLWAQAGLKVWSNVALDEALDLPHPRQGSREHTALDLGDDAFTVGRPHPMIDQAARIERLMAEAADPTVRVVVLDVVIGWGANADPAAELAPAIARAKALARAGGRHLAVVGFVCGTENDPQVLSRQEAALRSAGMVLAGNSANAAWLAAQWVR